jgi:FlaA1/EpsC-like NDP-sugar epimerase
MRLFPLKPPLKLPLKRPRLRHARVAYVHDIVMATLSFAASLYLRVGDQIGAYQGVLIYGSAIMAVTAAVIFRSLKLYRGIWRYASIEDLLGLLRASTLVILAFVPALFILTRAEMLPRSVPVINWFLLLCMIGGPRFLYRVAKDRVLGTAKIGERPPSIPVLLVGAHDGAELFIRATNRGAAPLYRAVGMVTEGSGRVGRFIHGVEVLGRIDEIPQVVERLAEAGERPQRIIITLDALGGAVLSRILEMAEGLGMTVARLPKLTEFREGMTDEVEVRPVAIEDLLGRPQTILDREAMRRLIGNRRVLVTGAGGTIGGELVRQIGNLAPAELTLIDNCEFALYTIDLETGERHPELKRRSVIADIRDRHRLDRVFAEARPELVFHAAALKHVPIVEANPFEGVLTNAVGSRHVADACRAAGVLAMVQISTDKAVNPTSIMGASKRIAESYCQALDLGRCRSGEEPTRFITVRFGNVLGSTGSVVPLFQRQLAAGGPLTVTHPDMMRYFMTVREAVELVLQASVLGSETDEAGKIFVLDMGEPVRILDLARQMIRLAGKRPEIDIGIRITGLRPGEKLFEEVFHGAEPLLPTACKGILLAAPRAADPAILGTAITEMAALCTREDRGGLVALLRRLVPEYQAPEAEVAEGDGGKVIRLVQPGR